MIVSVLRTFALAPWRGLLDALDMYPILKLEDDEHAWSVLLCENKYFVMYGDSLKTDQAIADAE